MSPHSQPLQQCQITYASMRAAFVTTLDSLLRYSLDPISSHERSSGFFECFSILSGAAPQIQLECLFTTWQRWNQGLESNSDLLDECVFYAAGEALLKLCTDPHGHALKMAMNGPRILSSIPDQWTWSKVRCLQVASLNPASEAFLRQLTVLNSSATGSEVRKVMANTGEDDLQELVGRWVARKDVVLESNGLLTRDEQDIVQAFFEEHPGLVR